MIRYALRCHKAHEFEVWFRDSAAFDKQKKAGEVSCPHCGSHKVEKAIMAPNVASRKGPSNREEVERATATVAMLRKMRQAVEKNADNVGDRFAEEARRIHYGEVKPRNIYGNTTKDEAEELVEEGVEFGVIPWVDLPDA
ncbi:DUF1178 family protein [Marinibaculum pumilum]|uniref:DUF1178 family protein n=1 Tax=Marinibaculum pumilum TaxID=1766165 RepID=A0ABV7KTJ6_9PROT